MAENTAAAAVPTEAEKMEEISEPSTSTEQVDGDDVDAEVKRLMGVGKRNLVMKDIRSAVNAFQEASSILGKKYGETADQCADAFYLYGTTLLEMARMESNVLGNALEGMPEEEDEDSEKEDPVVPSASNLDEKEREELREQVYDAMAEKEEKSEKNGADSKEPDTEEMECDKSAEAPEIQDKTEGDTVKTNGDAAETQDKPEGDAAETQEKAEGGATETQEKDIAAEGEAAETQEKDIAAETQDKAEGDAAETQEKDVAAETQDKAEGDAAETQEKGVAAETQDKAEGDAAETQEKGVAAETQEKAEGDAAETQEKDVAAETQDKAEGDSATQEKVEAAETQDEAKGDAAETGEKAEAETQEKAEGNTAENKAEGDSLGTQEKGEADTQEKAEGDAAEVEKAMEVVETKPETSSEAEVSTETVKNKTEDVEIDSAQESEKPEDKTDDKPKDAENSDAAAKPEETATTAVEKEDQSACDDEAEPMEGAEEEDAESDNEETDEKEHEEEVDNLQLAWEMLDLSKIIFKRQENKESQLKAAQAYLKLGEVSIESENYTQAVEDFLVCLSIQKEHLVEHDRLLAETHYQLGLAYQYSGKHDNAISHFNQSIAVIEKKMEQLEKATEQSKEETQKEMEELKGLLPDIKEKIEDSKEAQKSMEDAGKALKETLGGTSSSFLKENGSASTSAEAEKSGDCTVPVTNCVSDISHLVRKKRKPEESPVKEAKKCKSEPVENGSSNGDAVVPTNKQVEEAENQTPMETATVESTA